mmetsp:Transcript_14156/g.32999  ORF Transcript_14156/g.32999 Transcript_14156/m.32999 type:complete len:227 (+) Transcript_14156:460-1140(+)
MRREISHGLRRPLQEWVHKQHARVLHEEVGHPLVAFQPRADLCHDVCGVVQVRCLPVCPQLLQNLHGVLGVDHHSTARLRARHRSAARRDCRGTQRAPPRLAAMLDTEPPGFGTAPRDGRLQQHADCQHSRLAAARRRVPLPDGLLVLSQKYVPYRGHAPAPSCDLVESVVRTSRSIVYPEAPALSSPCASASCQFCTSLQISGRVSIGCCIESQLAWVGRSHVIV